MLMTAYVQASQPGLLQLWIGMFGVAAPPMPKVSIDRQTRVFPLSTTNGGSAT